MIKFAGSVLIVAAFFLLGRKTACFKRKRLSWLEEVRLSLADFKAAIDVFDVPVPEALEKSGLTENKKSFFNADDQRDYRIFIKGTKSETKEGQLLNINTYDDKLEKEEMAERTKYSNEAKLIKGGLTLGGILLVIVLL